MSKISGGQQGPTAPQTETSPKTTPKESPAQAEQAPKPTGPHQHSEVEQQQQVQARKELWKLDAKAVHSGPKTEAEVEHAVQEQLAGAHLDEDDSARFKRELMQAGVSAHGGVSQSLGQGPATAKAKLGPGKHAYGTTATAKLTPKLDPKQIDTAAKLAKKHTELDTKLKKLYPNGVTFKPPFKPPTSAAAAHAKNALLHLPKQAGAEGDHIVNLNGKKTMVTLRAEDKTVKGTRGAAVSVEIVGTKVPKLDPALVKPGVAKKKLETEFGVKIQTSPKAFSDEQLAKIYMGFKKLSPDEAKALQGVTLKRVDSLSKNRAAEFKWDEQPSGTPPSAGVTSEKSISFTDKAFAADDTRFVGGKNNATFPSVRTVLHEAGHAIETHKRRTTLGARIKAEADYENAVPAYKSAFGSWLTAAKKQKGAQLKPVLRFHRATLNAQKKLEALRKASPSQVTSRKAALDAALTKRDAALAALKKAGAPVHTKAKALATHQSTAAGAAHRVATSKAAEKASRAKKTRGTLVNAQNKPVMKSKRLARFDAYVKRHGVKPFTNYAASFHAKGGEEFYAEAYSLYKTDPKWMEKNSPKLFQYFKSGQHMKE